MIGHELKVDCLYFKDLCSDEKKSEVRLNDRNYQKCQVVILYEYNSNTGFKTGRSVIRLITHVLSSEKFSEGLKAGYCVLSLERIHHEAWLNLLPIINWRDANEAES